MGLRNQGWEMVLEIGIPSIAGLFNYVIFSEIIKKSYQPIKAIHFLSYRNCTLMLAAAFCGIHYPDLPHNNAYAWTGS